MKRLITSKEFEILKKERSNLVILDCRFDLMNKNYGPDAYKKGHIKGAFLVDIEKDLTDTLSKHGGRHPFKNIPDFVKVLEHYGISNETTVVCYDDGDLQGAGRLVFQLNQVGHKNAFVLDGGLLGYKNSGYELESKENTPNFDNITYIPHIDNSYFVDMKYVKSKLYNEGTMIIDSRSKPRYLGLEEPVDKVAGHIPSAKSYFYQDVLDLENMNKTEFVSSFKSMDYLNEHYKDLRNKDEVIVYCGSGISLMVNALALDKCGIDYKIYPGSYSDWISYDDNKIETKDE